MGRKEEEVGREEGVLGREEGEVVPFVTCAVCEVMLLVACELCDVVPLVMAVEMGGVGEVVSCDDVVVNGVYLYCSTGVAAMA